MRHCRASGFDQGETKGETMRAWCQHAAVRRGAPDASRVSCRDASARAVRNGESPDPTMLVYVFDVYDPWAWAYLPSVGTVLDAACSVVDVEVVIAGRHDDSPVSALAGSVEDVRRTGTRFGRSFLRELESGELVLDSARAAAGIIGLLAADERQHVAKVLQAVQREFFVHGRTIDTPGVLSRVATRLGLDGPAIEVFAASERAQEMAHEDFAVALDLDADLRPLLIASHAGTVFEFDGLGASGDWLVNQFRSVLARP
jgi:protein-disulfide isomerase-like protein with CxxC motif